MFKKADQIHCLGYLLSEEINLAHLESDETTLFTLKSGTEILSVSAEIIEKANTGTFDFGITGSTDFFLNDIDLTRQEVFKSKMETKIKEDVDLILDTNAREGIIRIRVFYFNPGKIKS